MKKVTREEIQVLQSSIWESILVLSLQHYYVDIWEKPMVGLMVLVLPALGCYLD